MNQIAKWRRTKNGSLFFGILSLALFYAFASLAIDSGNLLHYFIALGLLWLGFRDIGAYVRLTSKKHAKPSAKRSRKKA